MIRKSHSKDVEALIELNLQVQGLHSNEFPDIFKENISRVETSNFFEGLLNQTNHYVFVFETNDEVVGYCWVEKIDSPETPFTYADSKLYIQHIGVALSLRNKGIGKKLVGRVKELAIELKIKHIGLDVWAFNEGSQSFFSSCGFTQYNRRMWLK